MCYVSSKPFLSTPWKHGQLEDKFQDSCALGTHIRIKESGAENTESNVPWKAKRVQSRR